MKMAALLTGVLSVLVSIAQCSKDLSFPPDFKFGAASSVYQIEGGWNASGTFDFYAINYYTSRMVRKAKPGEKLGYWPFVDAPDIGAHLDGHPKWKKTAAFWFYAYPAGLRYHLVWLKKQYGDIEFLITESGYPTAVGLDDEDRVSFINESLHEVLHAIKVDGVNVSGYAAWSLMDNFEWLAGFRMKFGLYQVDFHSPERTRTPRASAHFYKHVIKAHSLRL